MGVRVRDSYRITLTGFMFSKFKLDPGNREGRGGDFFRILVI